MVPLRKGVARHEVGVVAPGAGRPHPPDGGRVCQTLGAAECLRRAGARAATFWWRVYAVAWRAGRAPRPRGARRCWATGGT